MFWMTSSPLSYTKMQAVWIITSLINQKIFYHTQRLAYCFLRTSFSAVAKDTAAYMLHLELLLSLRIVVAVVVAIAVVVVSLDSSSVAISESDSSMLL